MDEKVYDDDEGQKLWSESVKLWKSLDKKATLYFDEQPAESVI